MGNEAIATEVLRRAYGKSLRTIEETLLFLLPVPLLAPDECGCEGRVCFGCAGRSFLIRPDDGIEYRKLLKCGLCVFDPNAVAPVGIHFHPQIPLPPESYFGTISQFLTISTLRLLLSRIGDSLMFFLLNSTSIFMSCSNTTHLHVSGPSLQTFINNSKQESKGNLDAASSIDPSSENFTLLFGGNKRKHSRLYSWQRRKKYRKILDNSGKKMMSSECHCSCCLMSRSFELDINTQIDRKPIFYKSSVPSSSAVPRNCSVDNSQTFLSLEILRLKPNTTDAGVLMEHIFGLSEDFFSTFTEKSGISVQFNDLTLLRLLKALIRNAHHCQFLNLLHKHCIVPISGFYSQDIKYTKTDVVDGKYSSPKACLLYKTTHPRSLVKDGLTKISPYSNPVKSYCRHDHVVSFIWAVSRSIIPIGLFGDSSIWRGLRKNISKFVRLRRFENVSLKQCMVEVKRTIFAFSPGCFRCSNISYKSNSDAAYRKGHACQIKLVNQFFRCWIYWYFSKMVVPIISTCFYVTEREGGRNEVFYYPKPIWTDLIREAIAKLKEHNYRRLDLSFLRKITCRRSFGFSKVRFLPKEKGIRLLANLNAPSKIWFPVEKVPLKCLATLESCRLKRREIVCTKKMKMVHFQSVNSALVDLNAIFKRVKREHPEYLGSSVFDYNDAYFILHPFFSKFKNGLVEVPKFYMVVSDVSKAFDSVDQDRLLNILSDILQEDKYVDNNGSRPIKEFATSRQQLCSSDGVQVKQGKKRNKKKEEIHSLLCEHLKGNVVKIDDGYYLQNVGIPQGSLLSSLLCSFYYGHMERNDISPFLQKIHNAPCSRVSTHGQSASCNKTNEIHSSKEWVHGNTYESGKPSYPIYVLLRFIDDFLFISTSKKLAIGFFNRLKRGFREYNCYMNIDKFGVNFDLEKQSEHFHNRIYTGPDGLSFLPWCGLLINCETMEIQADYTRYLTVHMSSTLTVIMHGEVIDHLKAKLCFYMKPKCHPLLFDSMINSPAIVRLNVYQAFLVCAMKFHCYICTLSKANPTPRSCAEIILESLSYTHSLIKKRMYNTERYGNIRPLLRLKKTEVIWLGLSAYFRVLMKKQSRHIELLSLLSSMLESFGNMEYYSSPLKYAVQEIHSSVFWKIKY